MIQARFCGVSLPRVSHGLASSLGRREAPASARLPRRGGERLVSALDLGRAHRAVDVDDEHEDHLGVAVAARGIGHLGHVHGHGARYVRGRRCCRSRPLERAERDQQSSDDEVHARHGRPRSERSG